MPLEGSRVIPAGWEEHHRPVMETTWTATITFTRISGPPVHDPATGSTSQPRTTVYFGPCRIQEHQINAHSTIAAGERITTHVYHVSLAVEADLQKNDVGTVNACNDPTFVGRELLVEDIQRGSLLFQRDAICIDNLEAVT